MNTMLVNYDAKVTIRAETELERWRAASAGSKEPETLAWIRSFEAGSKFLDIGANIGLYSLYAAKKRVQTLALEPHPGNFMALAINQRQLNRALPMRVMCGGAGAKDEMRDFWFDTVEAGTTGGSYEATDGTGRQYVRIYTVDYLMLIHGPFDHIKIDVDGSEMQIVRGMTKSLKSRAFESCLIEVDPGLKGIITATFEQAGYSLDNEFNTMTHHSRERRAEEGINVENIVFTRVP